ncbi:MAG UNVERIFIED_CONTAM: hypothetical protein LVR18_19060 [Planctomycetaceae bacterium]
MAQAREAEANGNRDRIAELKPQITEIQQLLKAHRLPSSRTATRAASRSRKT